jgi:urease accessory protein UreF
MTNAAQIGQLMQWLSPAYPVGSFAYSHGLERAVHDGWVRDGVSLQPWLEDILTDGAGFSDACLLFSAANAPDAQNLRDIDTLAQSLSPSKERLAETHRFRGIDRRAIRLLSAQQSEPTIFLRIWPPAYICKTSPPISSEPRNASICSDSRKGSAS